MSKETTERIEIVIEIDNQAFKDDFAQELANVLEEAQLKLNSPRSIDRDIFLHDSNGNNVGFIKYIKEDL